MKPYRILSLDGGGINGLLQMRIMDNLGLLPDDFDLIAGTSIGAINACGLRLGLEPGELVLLYVNEGRRIFPPYWKRALTGRPLGGLVRARYSNSALIEVLRETLGDALMGDVKPLITTAVDQNSGDFQVFKSWKHYQKLLRDAAAASSAAPVFFPAAGQYVDGGLCANHPGDVAKAEAISRGVPAESIELISIGCGYDYEPAPSWAQSMGVIPFGAQALEMIMRTQVRKTHQILKREMGDRYKRFNVRFNRASGKMDDASEQNIQNLIIDADTFREVD